MPERRPNRHRWRYRLPQPCTVFTLYGRDGVFPLSDKIEKNPITSLSLSRRIFRGCDFPIAASLFLAEENWVWIGFDWVRAALSKTTDAASVGGFRSLILHLRVGGFRAEIGFPDARSGLRCAQRFWAVRGDFSYIFVEICVFGSVIEGRE